MKITIAIDGFSSSGKSTMAKTLAKNIGYAYIDSGAMYRAVTLYALTHNMIDNGKVNEQALVDALPDISISFALNPDTGVNETHLNGLCVESEIRQMQVSNNVSPVAAIAAVRREMVRQQQQMGRDKGIVMDGRDIGTTVFPDAEMKVFVNASPEVRAKRRYEELTAKGDKVNYEDVLKNVTDRDHLDMTRQESPLRKADDALVLDNDHMTREQQNQWLLDRFHEIAK